MKATIVLLANNEAENFGRRLTMHPSNVLGYESGCIAISAEKSDN